MKTRTVRLIGHILVLVVFALSAFACNSDKKDASATAEAFLQAYYVDLDFSKALQLSNDVSHPAINDQAELITLNPYAAEETPQIVVQNVEIDKNNVNVATCTYSCNRKERKLPLRKYNDTWLINLEGKTVETAGTENDLIELSSEGSNGFASAVSGEIKYKKRTQKN